MCLISKTRILLKSGVSSFTDRMQHEQKHLNDPCKFSPPGFVSWPSALPVWALCRPIIRAPPPGKWVMSLRLWDYGPGDVWFLNPAAHGKKRKHTTCPPWPRPPPLPKTRPLVRMKDITQSPMKTMTDVVRSAATCIYTCVICGVLDELFSNQAQLSNNDI